MYRIAALIVDDTPALRFAGLDLARRAERIVRRAGVKCVHVVGDERPFADVPLADRLLVLPARLVVEPGAVIDLLRRGLQDAEDAVIIADASGRETGLMLLSFEATESVRPAGHIRAAGHRLAVECAVRVIRMRGRFVRRVRDARDISRLETEYLRHVNGGDGEGWFTQNIRLFSIPLSRRLLRLSVTANQVTMSGFLLSALAGLAFAIGGYAAGVAGGLLYWASMVLDCCGGEVARGSLTESKFGAWLETVTDYLSYFVVLGGIVWGDARVEGF